ncbi:MAG: glycoside hydrolase family 10 protein [Candidatus Neomarinimicrobiota bacterium]
MVRYKKATAMVAFFIFIATFLYPKDSSSKLNFRALWVVRSSMVNREEIDKALQFAKDYKFNHVFVQVRGRGDALYNSQFAVRSELIEDSKFDPLEYVIEKGHALDLKVHAWINVFLAWTSKRLPNNNRHITVSFPEWLDKSSFNKRTHNGGPNFYEDNNTPKYLSPSHPGVRNHLINILEEIITVYDLDGIHLDYIRYADSDFGYNMSARIMFEEQYGVDPLNLITENESGYYNLNELERKKLLLEWGNFRREAITNIVKSFNSTILNRRPDCLLSAAVKPNPNEAKNRFFQEWDIWLAEGLIDYAVPMNYAAKSQDFIYQINSIREKISPKYWPGIVMGIAAYNQEVLDTRDKIRVSREEGITGISIFSYDSHKENPELFLPIGEELGK